MRVSEAEWGRQRTITWMFSEEEEEGAEEGKAGREERADEWVDDLDELPLWLGVQLPVEAGEMLSVMHCDSERCLSLFVAGSLMTASSRGDRHSECARLPVRLTGGDSEKASSIMSLLMDRRGLLAEGERGDSGETEAMEQGVSAETGEPEEAATSLKRTAGRSMTSDGFLRIACFTLCA